MTPPRITRDEWLVALGDAVRPVDADALSVQEVSEKYSMSRLMAYRRLEDLVAQHRAAKTWKFNRNGTRRIPAYKLLT